MPHPEKVAAAALVTVGVIVLETGGTTLNAFRRTVPGIAQEKGQRWGRRPCRLSMPTNDYSMHSRKAPSQLGRAQNRSINLAELMTELAGRRAGTG